MNSKQDKIDMNEATSYFNQNSGGFSISASKGRAQPSLIENATNTT